MKLTKSVLLLVFCFLSFSLCLYAQTTTLNSASSESEFAIVVKDIYRKDGIASVTTLDKLSINIPNNETDQLVFDSFFAYLNKSKQFNYATISFYLDAKGECKFGDTDITFVVDGEPILINYRTRRKNRGFPVATSMEGRMIDSRCREQYDVLLEDKLYLKITKAKRSIEVRMDKIKFKFSEFQLKALNELARRIRS